MISKNIYDQIESVFINELGRGSSIILKQNLNELGLARGTLQAADTEKYVTLLLKDYDKVLRGHARLVKQEIDNLNYD